MPRGDFPPSEGDFPPIGAVLDAVRPSTSLPTWVRVGPLMRRNNGTVLHGQLPGFLGAQHGPFVVRRSGDLPESAVPAVEAARFDRRFELLDPLEKRFAEQIGGSASIPPGWQPRSQRAAPVVCAP